MSPAHGTYYFNSLLLSSAHSLMDTLADFLLAVSNATKLRGPQLANTLARVFSLDPSNQAIVKLYNVGYLDEKQIENAVEARRFYNEDWTAFNLVVVSFVRLANQMNPWSVLESFDLYAAFLNDLAVAFTNKTYGYVLASTMQAAIGFIIPLATQLDTQLVAQEMHRKPRLTYLAAVLLRIFNNIRSQLGAGDHAEAAKKAVMLYVGIQLCLTYFKLDNPLLCRNVFSNMSNAGVPLKNYPINQQIHYRYYLARFYMVKCEFVDAYVHFVWCLDHIPSNYTKDNRNVTRILRDLIPVAIILGRTPRFPTVYMRFYSSARSAPPFIQTYAQLTAIVKKGLFSEFQQFLTANYATLKHSQLLTLLSRACLVLLRNLIKRAWIIQGKTPRLDYNVVATALFTSLQGLSISGVVDFGISPSTRNLLGSIDDATVENCLITLIDQNLVKGKLFPRLRICSLSKSGAFPPADSINFVKFGHGGPASLSQVDRWME